MLSCRGSAQVLDEWPEKDCLAIHDNESLPAIIDDGSLERLLSCGDAQVLLSNADDTVGLYLSVLHVSPLYSAVNGGPTSWTWSLPDPDVDLRLRAGAGLSENQCGDVFFYAEGCPPLPDIIVEHSATAGRVELSVVPVYVSEDGFMGRGTATLVLSGVSFDANVEPADIYIDDIDVRFGHL